VAEGSPSFLDLDRGRLAYDLDGDGPAVVFIHEGIADRRMWLPQVKPFVSAGYRVVRYDLRGFGETELRAGEFSNEDDLLGLLDHLSIESASLVGASYGGRISLELALSHPDRVDALVLVGAGLRDWEWSDEVERLGTEEEQLLEAGDIDSAVELNLRAWVDGPSRTPDEVDPAVREQVREMQRQALEIQVAVPDAGPDHAIEPAASERLNELACPTLVVVGDLDQPDILRIADRLSEGIPRARKEVIVGTAHVPSMEKPAEFNELVLGFLSASGLAG
jgi:3-oxoadipate enol-lactonase